MPSQLNNARATLIISLGGNPTGMSTREQGQWLSSRGHNAGRARGARTPYVAPARGGPVPARGRAPVGRVIARAPARISAMSAPRLPAPQPHNYSTQEVRDLKAYIRTVPLPIRRQIRALPNRRGGKSVVDIINVLKRTGHWVRFKNQYIKPKIHIPAPGELSAYKKAKWDKKKEDDKKVDFVPSKKKSPRALDTPEQGLAISPRTKKMIDDFTASEKLAQKIMNDQIKEFYRESAQTATNKAIREANAYAQNTNPQLNNDVRSIIAQISGQPVPRQPGPPLTKAQKSKGRNLLRVGIQRRKVRKNCFNKEDFINLEPITKAPYIMLPRRGSVPPKGTCLSLADCRGMIATNTFRDPLTRVNYNRNQIRRIRAFVASYPNVAGGIKTKDYTKNPKYKKWKKLILKFIKKRKKKGSGASLARFFALRRARRRRVPTHVPLQIVQIRNRLPRPPAIRRPPVIRQKKNIKTKKGKGIAAAKVALGVAAAAYVALRVAKNRSRAQRRQRARAQRAQRRIERRRHRLRSILEKGGKIKKKSLKKDD